MRRGCHPIGRAIAGGILSIPSECVTNVEIRIEALAFLGFEGGNPGQELR